VPDVPTSLSRVDIGKVVSTLSGIQNISTIEQLNAQKGNLIQALTDLKTHVTDQDNEINDLSQQVSASQSTLVGLKAKSDSLEQQVFSQQATIDRLNAKLAAAAAAPAPADATALANSFRKVVDQIQSAARLQSASGPATTIKSMDIEVKGLVSVQSDGSTGLVLPSLTSVIDGSQLSTLRVSYAAVPGTGSAPPPVVSSVTANKGPGAGGTSVVIAGSGFTGAGAVLFGSSPAASFSVVSDTQITAVSPSGSGVVDVVVITTAGGGSTTTPADHFTYIPAPTVTGINPSNGPAAGGTQVTVTGVGFTGATAATFGPTVGQRLNAVSDTQIVVLSPAGSPGAVDIVITTPGGTSNTSPADQFTYNPPPPTVTGVTPKGGLLGGGTSVTVTGTNFSGATAVTFGKNASPKFEVGSDTQLVAVSPKGSALGVVDIIVTTPSGNSAASQADQFSYLATPPPVPPAPVADKPKRPARRRPRTGE